MLKPKHQSFGWLFGRDPDAGKDGRQKGEGGFRGWDGYSTPDWTDINLSKLQKIVKDRGAWPAAIHGVSKESNRTWDMNNNNLRQRLFFWKARGCQDSRSRHKLNKHSGEQRGVCVFAVHWGQIYWQCCLSTSESWKERGQEEAEGRSSDASEVTNPTFWHWQVLTFIFHLLSTYFTLHTVYWFVTFLG